MPTETSSETAATAAVFPIASLCTSTAWGGMEMNIVRFLRWMKQRGWPTFLYGRPETPMYRHAGAAEIAVRPVATTSRYGSPISAYQTARQLDRDQIRAMIVHQSRDMLLGTMTRRLSKSKPIYLFYQHMHIGGDRCDFYHAWLYRQLTAFVTPIPILADQVRARTVVPEERLHIIARGIELDRFAHQGDTRTQARAALAVPAEPPLLGLIGRVDPQKGQLSAIRALKRVHETGRNLHLVLVGAKTHGEETGYEEEVRAEVTRLGLADSVHFRDYLREPELAFAALDYFVMASRSETYGMVTIEAMASGLPILGTAAGGTQNLISHETNGLLYPPEDDRALADGLMRYLDDPAFAAAMGAQAKEDAHRRFAHIRQCEAWEHLLRHLTATETG